MEDFGVLSILPPLLSLVLAIATRNVIVSLGLGVFVGMTIFNGFNPFLGLFDFFDRGVFVQLTSESNAKVVVIISIIGGFVHLLDQSGGMRSFAKKMTAIVNSKVKAQLAVWILGISIFFTDSGNALILGPMFRPIFSALRICREKLAFIIDSTSSPVCVLIPVISWGVYIMSLMEQSFTQLRIEEAPLTAFVGVLPFQFYPLLAIASVPLLAFSLKEWGPMARAQERELERSDDAEEADGSEGGDDLPEKRASSRAILLPLGTLLAALTALFGYYLVRLGSLPGEKIQVSLVIAYLAGTLVCALVLAREKVYSYKDSFHVFIRGMGGIVLILVILLLAWSLGDVCRLLGTGDYVATFFDGFLNPGLLPAVLFFVGAVVSLSTGSSWGTFALLMPIAIPVAHQLDGPLYVTIASVLCGGMFGDHCSPVSDTTILSSMATGCKHADHVNTQLAYAMVTGVTTFIAFLIAGFTGFTGTIAIALVIQVAAVVTIMKFFGVPVIREKETRTDF